MRPKAASGAMARLADYFVEVVAEPAGNTVEGPPQRPSLCAQLTATPSSTHAEQQQQQQESGDFERKIVTRIPLSDHQDFALPDGVPYVSG